MYYFFLSMVYPFYFIKTYTYYFLIYSILLIVLRIAREEENGLMGFIQTGASKDLIQEYTTEKLFSSDLMDSSSALYVVLLSFFLFLLICEKMSNLLRKL